MKKSRILCIVLSIIMVMGVFAGCANQITTDTSESQEVVSSTTPTDTSDSQESDSQEVVSSDNSTDTSAMNYPSGEELKSYGFKFGFMYPSFSDALGKRIKKVCEETCAMLGIEPVFSEMGMDMEGSISTIQNQVEMGCDTVAGSFSYYEIFKMCSDNNVIQMFPSGTVEDPDLLTYIATMDSFGGAVSENDYDAAVDAVNTLYDAGCRNIGLLTFPAGIADFMENRNAGVRDAVAAHEDMNLIVEYSGFPGSYGEALTQWISLYPELDGAVMTSNDGTGEAAIYSAGVEDSVKLAVFDLQDGTPDAIRDGVVAWCATGQENTWVISIILAYNQMLGHDLIEDNTVMYFRPFLYIKGVDSLDAYEEYVDGDSLVYNEQEVKSLIKEWNPEVSIEDIIKVNENYSIEDIIARRSN